MPIPRNQQIDLEKTTFYHCISRCVRRAFLCGNDRLTGNNYDHRRQWMVDRLKFLTSVFCIRIVTYSIMSNHFHVILHVDMEAALSLSDQEVIDRWKKLFDKKDEKDKRKQKSKLERSFDIPTCRERLYNISWFMRCLNENIARLANAEDQCKGRFWEGRFKCQALLDKGALLACMAYTDLNPIRAGMATTPESSDYTSIQERIHQYWDEHQKDRVDDLKYRNGYKLGTGLLPFADHDTLSPRENQEAFIPITRLDYFDLVDWTGRQLREGKSGAIPSHIRPILQRLELDEQEWVPSVSEYKKRFFLMVGKFSTLTRIAAEMNKVRFKGKQGVLALYREQGPPRAS